VYPVQERNCRLPYRPKHATLRFLGGFYGKARAVSGDCPAGDRGCSCGGRKTPSVHSGLSPGGADFRATRAVVLSDRPRGWRRSGGAVWDGSITATGGTIVGLTGWRFYGTDAISGSASSGNWSWKATLRTTPSFSPPGPVQETGVIVTVAGASGPVTFNVTTAKQGNFSFLSTDVPFGVTKFFLPSVVRLK
jgi:hypothetical protein